MCVICVTSVIAREFPPNIASPWAASSVIRRKLRQAKRVHVARLGSTLHQARLTLVTLMTHSSRFSSGMTSARCIGEPAAWFLRWPGAGVTITVTIRSLNSRSGSLYKNLAVDSQRHAGRRARTPFPNPIIKYRSNISRIPRLHGETNIAWSSHTASINTRASLSKTSA